MFHCTHCCYHSTHSCPSHAILQPDWESPFCLRTPHTLSHQKASLIKMGPMKKKKVWEPLVHLISVCMCEWSSMALYQKGHHVAPSNVPCGNPLRNLPFSICCVYTQRHTYKTLRFNVFYNCERLVINPAYILYTKMQLNAAKTHFYSEPTLRTSVSFQRGRLGRTSFKSWNCTQTCVVLSINLKPNGLVCPKITNISLRHLLPCVQAICWLKKRQIVVF